VGKLKKSLKVSLQKFRCVLYYDSVASDEGKRLIDTMTGFGQAEIFEKIFKFELVKTKIGDILRIRCVLSATRLLDKLP